MKAWSTSRSWKACRDARRAVRSLVVGLGWGSFVIGGKTDVAAGAVMPGLRFRFLPLLVVVAGLALAPRRGRVTFRGGE